MDSLLLRSNRVVAGGTIAPAAIEIRAGKIVRLAPRDTDHPNAIDFGSHALLPALVDTHVHVNEPGRTEWEGFATAGRAAAAGGIGTIVAMPLNCSPVATTPAALQAEAAAATGTCLVDFGLWGGLIPGNTDQIAPLLAAGALGFKCFMVPSGIDEFPHVTPADLAQAAPILVQHNALLLAHAEDPDLIAAALPHSGLLEHPRSYRAYLASRPPSAEAAAVRTLARLSRDTGVRTHIVHIAAASALLPLREARRAGLPITAEACPHYLYFSDADILDGSTIYKCAPPIRDLANQRELWYAIADGSLDLVASDHSPCPFDLKCAGEGDFAKAWGGIIGLQLTLPVMWKGMQQRQGGLATLAELLCAAPARLAGIAHRKGTIAPGMDADIIVFDPDTAWSVDAFRLHHRHKNSPYHRAKVRGVVHRTYVRGNLIYDNGTFPTEPAGQWIKHR